MVVGAASVCHLKGFHVVSTLLPFLTLSPSFPCCPSRGLPHSCPVWPGLSTHLLLLLKRATTCQVLPALRMAQTRLLKGAVFCQLQQNGMVSALSYLCYHIYYGGSDGDSIMLYWSRPLHITQGDCTVSLQYSHVTLPPT